MSIEDELREIKAILRRIEKLSPSLLGKEVKNHRKLLKLTQQEVADKAGITQATLSRLESGKIQHLRCRKRLAKILGIEQ